MYVQRNFEARSDLCNLSPSHLLQKASHFSLLFTTVNVL